MNSFKKQILNGSIWTIGGQLLILLISLVSNIWIARVLSPNEFGKIGIVMFFITLANVFTEGGLAGALIRKTDTKRIDYSTVFVFNLVVSICCYILLFLTSNAIASYYQDYELKAILNVSGIVLIINAFQITQNAKMMSDLKFKERVVYRFIAVFFASIVGVILAYCGLKVWSLVSIQIITAALTTILLWLKEGFFIDLRFSKSSFKELYSFGVNTTLASLLNTAFDNIYQLILGKYFSINQVGLYYQAKKLQDIPGGLINMLTQSVVFSSLAKLQDDKERFRIIYSKLSLYFMVILGVITLLTFSYSDIIIKILYGDKWMAAIFFMKTLSIASFFYMQEKINKVVFKVYNKTHQILYLEILKKMVQSLSIFIGLFFLDLNVLIYGFIITNAISYLINIFYSTKIIQEGAKYEYLILLKISLVLGMLIFLHENLMSYLELSNIYKALGLPLLLFAYFYSLKILGVINVFKILVSYVKKNI